MLSLRTQPPTLWAQVIAGRGHTGSPASSCSWGPRWLSVSVTRHKSRGALGRLRLQPFIFLNWNPRYHRAETSRAYCTLTAFLFCRIHERIKWLWMCATKLEEVSYAAIVTGVAVDKSGTEWKQMKMFWKDTRENRERNRERDANEDEFRAKDTNVQAGNQSWVPSQ